MEWFIAVVVIAILGVAAVVAAGRMGAMQQDPVQDTFRQDLPTDRPLVASDLKMLRLGVAPRGYVMSQVDELLDRLSAEMSVRERLPAEGAPGTFPEPVEGRTADTAQPEEPDETDTETANENDFEDVRERE